MVSPVLRRILRRVLPVCALLASTAYAQIAVSEQPAPKSVRLGALSDIVIDPRDAELVGIAARDLADDIGKVSGKAAAVAQASKRPVQVWVGTPGHHADIDALVRRGRLDAHALANCWECFIVTTVEHPKPGVDAALVIVGSDRRGAAYGVYELSQALGVSAWHWWADVAPLRKQALYVSVAKPYFAQPSVRYRGIFINDEDWGLFPWAANNYESGRGNIGPKTYEAVYRLLLRLKANTLWPAMHKVSAPFNTDPDNARLAQRYGIVMGSSHAEPMLRNNVGEWTDKAEQFNYAINPEGVTSYWSERLASNGRFENLYTLGMRGIHDSAMLGARTLQDKQALLNRVIADQRALLKQHVGDPAKLPQIFVPYKEVLDVYRAGLALPDDVTLVWPDDNFGYIRHFSTPAEERRSGGAGVYYHLSYLGAPLSYLWLSTTPPALLNEEMTRAFDHGGNRLWIFNPGDIKPAEVNLSHAFDLAWNVPAMRDLSQQDYLSRLAGQLFGQAQAAAIGRLWDRYYRFNAERRPEHLQYYLPKEAPHPSGLSASAVRERLGSAEQLIADAERIKQQIPAEQRNGFFQLVEYPVVASALANQRFFALEAYAAQADNSSALALTYAGHARRADARIKELTRQYNTGKWAGIMAEELPAKEWTSFRLSPLELPAAGDAPQGPMTVEGPLDDGVVRIEAEDFANAQWKKVDSLGRGQGSVKALVPGASLRALATIPQAGAWCVGVRILPTFPTEEAPAWKLEIAIDDGPSQAVSLSRGPQDQTWKQGVLNNVLRAEVPAGLGEGQHAIRLVATQPDLMLDGVDLRRAPAEGCP
jgi:hypothetical protein